MILVYLALSNLFYSISCAGYLPLYAGLGYDLLKGNPKTNIVDPGFKSLIFATSYTKQQTTEDGYYIVPDYFTSRSTISCSYTSTASSYTGMTSYQKDLSVLASASGSYSSGITSASFSASTAYQSRQSGLSHNTKIFIESSASCQIYSLTFQEYNSDLLISSNFNQSINQALQGIIGWDDVIASFGTHYVTSVILGGRTHLQNKISRNSYQKLTSMNINVNTMAQAKFAKWSGDVSVNTSSFSSQLNAFDSSIEETNVIYVGGKPPTSGVWTDWQNTVQASPAPVSYTIKPITKLFNSVRFPWLSSGELTNLVNQYTDAVTKYCNTFGCTAPSTDPAFPSNVTFTSYTTDGYGGNGGSSFYEPPPSNPIMTVRKVLIRSGANVDNLQFFVSDGVNSYYTSARGGSGGSYQEWEVPSGEVITQVEVRSGARVDALTFITDKGTKSPRFGGTGGSYYMVNLYGNLVSFLGRSGARLDRIQFISYNVKYES